MKLILLIFFVSITSMISLSAFGQTTAYTNPYSFTIYYNGTHFIIENATSNNIFANTNGGLVLQKAINFAKEGDSIFIKQPHTAAFAINGINVNKTGLNIIGESSGFYFVPSPFKTLFLWCYGTNVKCMNVSADNVRISNIFIGSSGENGQTGLYVNSTSGSFDMSAVFDMIIGGSFDTGVYLDNSRNNDFRSLSIYGANNGLVLNGVKCLDTVATVNNFEHLNIVGATGKSIWFNQCADNNSFESVHIVMTGSSSTGIVFGSPSSKGWFSDNYIGRLAISGGGHGSVLFESYPDIQEPKSMPLVVSLANMEGTATIQNIHTGASSPILITKTDYTGR